jgi:uncharacterized tellurite resistance protein B-like protein
MLDRIKALFVAESEAAVDDEARLHLAAAVLLVEVAKADHSLERFELDRLRKVLKNQWSLGEHDLDDLVAVARTTAEDSVSLHEHVDLINRCFSPGQKLGLMRGLWEVACADEQIHHYEEALIRRLADLLYVSHAEFIRSKHLALSRA